MQGDARSVRMWTTGNTQYTETKYYAVEREGNVSLRNLTENALKKANVKLTSGVMPYAYDKMKDFHMGYLSGFLAERRDIEQNIVQGKMQHTMRESAEKLMRDTISGYNSVSVKNTFFAPKKETWSYVLLPVWTITYKGRDGKVYYYSMNGQNGNICGDLPVDRPRLALTSLLTGAWHSGIRTVRRVFLMVEKMKKSLLWCLVCLVCLVPCSGAALGGGGGRGAGCSGWLCVR